MINIGIAGIGFMGMIHYLSYKKVRGAKVRAICEQDPKRLAGDWRSIKGNFGPPGEMMDLEGIEPYAELEDLLADPSIDVVDVCLPPALHAEVTIKALRAGKHVFCEKPIALSASEAKRMVDTADHVGKQLLIGHVLPFYPQFEFVWKAARSGKYGKILGGEFKRVISNPLWLPDFFNPAKVGGPMLDLHVHDAHFIRLLFGMPRAVQSVGRMRGDLAEHFTTQFLFDDPALVVTATSGIIGQQGRPFMHGFEVHFERATVVFDFSALADGMALTPMMLFDHRGGVLRPKLGSGDPADAFAAELSEVVRAVKTGEPSAILDGQLARDAVVICQKETESVRKGKMVKV